LISGSSHSPIGSLFGAVNTASDAIKGIDPTRKVAIVTGGYFGLGLEMTKALVSSGNHAVGLPARSPIDSIPLPPLDRYRSTKMRAFAHLNHVAAWQDSHILFQTTSTADLCAIRL
jgi:NAD(P)-dependent dehydrogenase (short-subunit alcohol dehydrogenase family)